MKFTKQVSLAATAALFVPALLSASVPQGIYGGYTGGCIVGAQALPMEGPGYIVMQPASERFYGHPLMISYLEELGAKLEREMQPKLLVEDISGPRGGPGAINHMSHQIGLDVDISLTMAERSLPFASRENLAHVSFVVDRDTMASNWTDTQVMLIGLAADAPNVNRIFVAPAIKKYFCENFPNANWLYRLRAWWGHDDHIHVRLNCPKGDRGCKAQARLNPRDKQCGSSLRSSEPYRTFRKFDDVVQAPSVSESAAGARAKSAPLPPVCLQFLKP